MCKEIKFYSVPMPELRINVSVPIFNSNVRPAILDGDQLTQFFECLSECNAFLSGIVSSADMLMDDKSQLEQFGDVRFGLRVRKVSVDCNF